MGCTQERWEVDGVIVRPLSVVFEGPWWSEEAPKYEKKANVAPIFKGKKEV